MTHQVVIILGSESDKSAVEESGMLKILDQLRITYEAAAISAHRNPRVLAEYVERKDSEGTKVFIGIAGMSAALPGAIAALTHGSRPVIGVGLSSSALAGLDAILSISRMPSGRPVMFAGLDEHGLRNATIAACQILAAGDADFLLRLTEYCEGVNKKPTIPLLFDRYVS